MGGPTFLSDLVTYLGIAFAAYWIIGSLLLRLPPLFVNKKLSRRLKDVRVIAHRGSKCEGFPEVQKLG
jgi:hypothetical protein